MTIPKIPAKYKPLAKRAFVGLGAAASAAAYAKYGPGGQQAVDAVWPYLGAALAALVGG